jgi:hypothetical protein
VDTGRAILGAGDVDRRRIEMDLLPTDVDQLANPQGVTEGQQDQQPVARRVSAGTGRVHQHVNLGLGQILALPIVGVLSPTTANCRLFRLRGPQLDNRIHWQIPLREFELSVMTTDIKRGRFSYPRGNDAATIGRLQARQDLAAAIDSVELAA